MKVWQKNLILIVLAVAIAALPLWLLPNAEFGGADGQAEEVVQELNPGYQPWFEPILEPASGEVESLLFALQAAVGAGIVGFVLGRITKKARREGRELMGTDRWAYQSRLRRVDPLPKLVLSLTALVVCLCCGSGAVGLATAAAMGVLIAALGGLPPRVYLHFLKIPMAFLAVGCATMLVRSYPAGAPVLAALRWGAAVGL